MARKCNYELTEEDSVSPDLFIDNGRSSNKKVSFIFTYAEKYICNYFSYEQKGKVLMIVYKHELRLIL